MSEKFKQYAFKTNTVNPNTHKLFPTFPIIFNSKHNKLFDASISLFFFIILLLWTIRDYISCSHRHKNVCIFHEWTSSTPPAHHSSVIVKNAFVFFLIFYVTHLCYVILCSMLYAPITKMQARTTTPTTNWKKLSWILCAVRKSMAWIHLNCRCFNKQQSVIFIITQGQHETVINSDNVHFYRVQ